MISRKAALALVLLTLVTSVVAVWAISASTNTDLRNSQRRVAAILRHNQLQACQRGNDLRRRIQHNNEVVRALFLTAAGAREQAGDAAIAKQYERYLGQLESQPVIDCNHKIVTP